VAKKIPAQHSRVMPYLHYRDPAAALDFLARAFGFTVRFAHRDETGVIRHAQVGVGDTTVMLGPVYPAFRSAAVNELPGLNASVWCYVDDADAHCERARAHGATILREPMDQPYGVREYDALDAEGQEWYFCQPLGDGRIAPKRKPKPRPARTKAARRKPARKKARRR
jgi:MerR family transcriptional regulator, thiopeptide resistance regulator